MWSKRAAECLVCGMRQVFGAAGLVAERQQETMRVAVVQAYGTHVLASLVILYGIDLLRQRIECSHDLGDVLVSRAIFELEEHGVSQNLISVLRFGRLGNWRDENETHNAQHKYSSISGVHGCLSVRF